jgi:hypothetical protein
VGAGYDLAPTVLDLLEIEHNARFILGRSLLRNHSRPDYFVKRYADVHADEVLRNLSGECGENSGLPLDSCQRRDLLELLESLVYSVSGSPDQISCTGDDSNRIRLPEAINEPLEVRVGGVDQSGRFTHRSRTVEPTYAGLYSLILDPQGRVLARRFQPWERLDQAEESAGLEVGRQLLIWRPHPEVAGSGESMVADDLGVWPDHALLRVVDEQGETKLEIEPRDGMAELDLRKLVCESPVDESD